MEHHARLQSRLAVSLWMSFAYRRPYTSGPSSEPREALQRCPQEGEGFESDHAEAGGSNEEDLELVRKISPPESSCLPRDPRTG
jgi:hypothetical protein